LSKSFYNPYKCTTKLLYHCIYSCNLWTSYSDNRLLFFYTRHIMLPELMRSNHQRIHWRFQLVQLLGLWLRSSKKLSMDFLKIHGLRWSSRGFVIIKSKSWLIWVIFKRGLLVEPRPLHKDWEKKTRFRQFDLSLLVWS